MSWLLVALGGALGSVSRYFLVIIISPLGFNFPLAILIANMVGSFLYGLLVPLIVYSPYLQFFLLTGVLGGFTTFSSFSYETWLLIKQGDYLYAILNVVLSTLLGLVFLILGYMITHKNLS